MDQEKVFLFVQQRCVEVIRDCNVVILARAQYNLDHQTAEAILAGGECFNLAADKYVLRRAAAQRALKQLWADERLGDDALLALFGDETIADLPLPLKGAE